MVLALLGGTPAAAESRRPQVRRPGFEMTADGGSRLFVALTGKAVVEERRAEKTITYVLKQTNIRTRNNTQALVTEHFNTPVQRARLVRKGADLHFVVDLRAASEPAWKLVERADGTADLQVDFPAGTFVTEVAAPTSRRLADPEDPAADGLGMWSTAGEASAPTSTAKKRRSSSSPANGLREKAEQLRVKPDAAATKRWQDAKKRQEQPAPLHGQGPTDEQMRELRAKKQAERDAVHRQQQELDRRGGAGTAVSHDRE